MATLNNSLTSVSMPNASVVLNIGANASNKGSNNIDFMSLMTKVSTQDTKSSMKTSASGNNLPSKSNTSVDKKSSSLASSAKARRTSSVNDNNRLESTNARRNTRDNTVKASSSSFTNNSRVSSSTSSSASASSTSNNSSSRIQERADRSSLNNSRTDSSDRLARSNASENSKRLDSSSRTDASNSNAYDLSSESDDLSLDLYNQEITETDLELCQEVADASQNLAAQKLNPTTSEVALEAMNTSTLNETVSNNSDTNELPESAIFDNSNSAEDFSNVSSDILASIDSDLEAINNAIDSNSLSSTSSVASSSATDESKLSVNNQLTGSQEELLANSRNNNSNLDSANGNTKSSNLDSNTTSSSVSSASIVSANELDPFASTDSTSQDVMDSALQMISDLDESLVAKSNVSTTSMQDQLSTAVSSSATEGVSELQQDIINGNYSYFANRQKGEVPSDNLANSAANAAQFAKNIEETSLEAPAKNDLNSIVSKMNVTDSSELDVETAKALAASQNVALKNTNNTNNNLGANGTSVNVSANNSSSNTSNSTNTNGVNTSDLLYSLDGDISVDDSEIVSMKYTTNENASEKLASSAQGNVGKNGKINSANSVNGNNSYSSQNGITDGDTIEELAMLNKMKNANTTALNTFTQSNASTLASMAKAINDSKNGSNNRNISNIKANAFMNASTSVLSEMSGDFNLSKAEMDANNLLYSVLGKKEGVVNMQSFASMLNNANSSLSAASSSQATESQNAMMGLTNTTDASSLAKAGTSGNGQSGLESFFNNRVELFEGRENATKNAETVANKVLEMAAKNLREIELELNPKSLGRMKVKIDINDANNASVSFAVSSATTKDLLENSAEKLKEALAQAGFELNDSQVTQDFNRESSEKDSAESEWQNRVMQALAAEARSEDWLQTMQQFGISDELKMSIAEDTPKATVIPESSTTNDGYDYFA